MLFLKTGKWRLTMLENKEKHCYNHEFENIRELLEILSDSLFSSPESSRGKMGTYVLFGESVMSAINTILVIDFCCRREFYADAFTLARKYRDDLMQYLFTLDVIQNIHGLSEDEIKKYDVLNPESLLNMILKEMQILSSGERKSQEELAVEAFMYNIIEDDLHSKDRRMYFDTSKYKANLMKRNSQIKVLMEKYLDVIWREIDRTLNNYVHANGIKYIYANYADITNKPQMKEKLITTVQNITTIFLCILAMLDGTKLKSMDYLDALEMGYTPEEGSQYWVSAIIVEYFDEHLNKIDKGLLEYIEKNNNYGMKFMLRDYE